MSVKSQIKYLFIILLNCSIVLLLPKSVFAAPTINILNFPSQVNKTEEFNVTFNITTDSLSSDQYYIKGRIGSTSATLNQGETYNPTSATWLSDTSSWSNFPTATSSITLRTKQTVVSGNNLLVIRLNKNSTSYDSAVVSLQVLEPSPTPTPTLTPTPTPQPAPTSPADLSSEAGSPTPFPTPTISPTSINNVFLSEVMVHPAMGENEWVELYNNNTYIVSLSGWYIDDVENAGSTPKVFSIDLQPNSYGVVELSSSIFNNDGDQVRLLDNNKTEKDSFEYSSSKENITWGRISWESDEFCQQNPSKGSVNNSCLDPTPTVTPTPTKMPTPTKSSNWINSSNSTNPPKSKSNPLQKNTNVSIYRYIDTSSTNANNNDENGEVLGISTENNPYYKNLAKLFSLLAFNYSVLTIFLICSKMKFIYAIDNGLDPPPFRPS